MGQKEKKEVRLHEFMSQKNGKCQLGSQISAVFGPNMEWVFVPTKGNRNGFESGIRNADLPKKNHKERCAFLLMVGGTLSNILADGSQGRSLASLPALIFYSLGRCMLELSSYLYVFRRMNQDNISGLNPGHVQNSERNPKGTPLRPRDNICEHVFLAAYNIYVCM